MLGLLGRYPKGLQYSQGMASAKLAFQWKASQVNACDFCPCDQSPQIAKSRVNRLTAQPMNPLRGSSVSTCRHSLKNPALANLWF